MSQSESHELTLGENKNKNDIIKGKFENFK